MRALGVGEQDWDAVIVCDGSGTSASEAAGWASVVYDRRAKYRRVLTGAMSGGGTTNIAELMPVLQSMLWYTQSIGQYAAVAAAPVKVHVITDSQVTATAGRKRGSRKANLGPLWAALNEVCGSKYCLIWHWLGRSKLDLNRLADYLAGVGRRALAELATAAAVRLCLPTTSGGRSLLDFNPVEDLPEDDLPPGAHI